MKRIIFMLLMSVVAFTACKNETGSRIVFDAGDLTFITSSVNKKMETMSALYGNAAAYQSLLKADSTLEGGTVLTLVTWKYHDNPYYYGSKINGELLRIETVRVDDSGKPVYELTADSVQNINDAETRIKYIAGFRVAPLP